MTALRDVSVSDVSRKSQQANNTHTQPALRGREKPPCGNLLSFFHSVVPNSLRPYGPGSSVQGISRQEGGMDGCFLFLGILPTQGSKLCLLDWQADSLALSHREAQEGTPSPKSQQAYVGSSGLVLMPPIHQYCTWTSGPSERRSCLLFIMLRAFRNRRVRCLQDREHGERRAGSRADHVLLLPCQKREVGVGNVNQASPVSCQATSMK